MLADGSEWQVDKPIAPFVMSATRPHHENGLNRSPYRQSLSNRHDAREVFAFANGKQQLINMSGHGLAAVGKQDAIRGLCEPEERRVVHPQDVQLLRCGDVHVRLYAAQSRD